ncbi:hypothetical protein PHLCEN_2v426 [Hermanssonia centrifuga]|uniref:DNA polymerase delta/zeta catalytic subunit N-terminal domain-containing protein n=1 Tax=Hermanssonia centrifuga TaxID=98765 RepID=A0A2R6S666_9APHY|nr:hypothetical protein PHLCEN_2v426 [Hermanssonia centrifuga]
MLTHSLNHAIAVSMKRNPRQSQLVRAIILVKGVHFYGFHSSYSPFLKVLIADPALVNRAATLLQSGAIMKTRFRVYESHLSYVLQFLCDFGLYGCGWIELADAWQRGRDYSADTSQFSQQQDMIFQFSPYYCQTRMPLEVDATAHQILNRHRITARNMHHKLDIPAPSLPPEPVVLSVRELWDDERRRRIARGLHPSPDIPKDPSENSRNAGREWAAEVRWWEEIQKRIENEGAQQTLQTGAEDWERWVMTTFESTEALWEAKWRSWKPARRPEDLSVAKLEGEEEQEPQENPYASASQGLASQYAAEDVYGDIDVDEDMLESQEVNRLVESEESAQQKRETGDTEKRAHDVSEDPAVDDELPPEPQYDDDNAYYEDATPKG